MLNTLFSMLAIRKVEPKVKDFVSFCEKKLSVRELEVNYLEFGRIAFSKFYDMVQIYPHLKCLTDWNMEKTPDEREYLWIGKENSDTLRVNVLNYAQMSTKFDEFCKISKYNSKDSLFNSEEMPYLSYMYIERLCIEKTVKNLKKAFKIEEK